VFNLHISCPSPSPTSKFVSPERENKGGVKIKSTSQYLVWPAAVLSTAEHLLLMDCTRFARSCCEMSLHQGTCKFPDISVRNGPSPHPPIQQVPDVLYEIEIRALRWPWQNTHSCLAGNHSQNEQYGCWHCRAGGSC
jgi:hypothetical protein